MPDRNMRTQTELRDDSKTLWYEFRVLRHIARILNSGGFTSDWASGNAHVESFAIHCRNLIFFFFAHDSVHSAGSPRSTDVLAVDFFDNPTHWDTICPRISDTLRSAKKQADKQIAHITEERRNLNQQNGPTASWKSGIITVELAHVMRTFLDHVPPKVLDSHVESDLRRLVSHLGISSALAPFSGDQQDSKKRFALQAKTDVRTSAPSSGTYGTDGRTK